MAVVDLTLNNSTSAAYGALANPGSAAQNTKNLPTIVSRKFTTSSTAKLLAANQYDILVIPAGAFVKNVTVIILTATGETSTLDVGDSAADTTFLTATDLNATAGTSVTSAVTAGKYYAAADKLRIQPNHDLDLNGVFVVQAEITYP